MVFSDKDDKPLGPVSCILGLSPAYSLCWLVEDVTEPTPWLLEKIRDRNHWYCGCGLISNPKLGVSAQISFKNLKKAQCCLAKVPMRHEQMDMA